MGKGTCSIDGCERPKDSRGWCSMHYQRWRSSGSPHTCTRPLPPLERLLARIDVDPATGCWVVRSSRLRSGYGIIAIGNRPNRGGTYTQTAHRLTYTELVGPVPEGLELDHLCRNPPCCNPDHLEPVTRAENIRRRTEARRRLAADAAALADRFNGLPGE